jgi:iron complex transport system ATP-binding protein
MTVTEEPLARPDALTATTPAALQVSGLSLAYDGRTVVEGLDLAVPSGAVTAVVGPNGCGKSTVLRGLARLLKPSAGTVTIADLPDRPRGSGHANGHGGADAGSPGGAARRDVWSLKPKEYARRVALLPQTPPVPEGITVVDLVGRGRHPHHTLVKRWSAADDEAVARAMRATDTLGLADRHVEELSGGQRQRVWIALTLAQDTDVILLDEPTTYLDVAHQVDVLDLLLELNRRSGTTIVMVLHDLNLAARYADHVVALRGGALVAQGRPVDVVDAAFVRDVFGLESAVVTDPLSGTPLVVPASRTHTTTAITTAATATVTTTFRNGPVA